MSCLRNFDLWYLIQVLYDNAPARYIDVKLDQLTAYVQNLDIDQPPDSEVKI